MIIGRSLYGNETVDIDISRRYNRMYIDSTEKEKIVAKTRSKKHRKRSVATLHEHFEYFVTPYLLQDYFIRGVDK